MKELQMTCSEKQKHHNFKRSSRFTKREALIDQWQVKPNATLKKSSKYIDYHLLPHIKELKSHVKDYRFYKKNQQHGKFPDNSILVTIDVRSLYTNIPNKKEIKAAETALKIKKFRNENHLNISPLSFKIT